MINVLLGLQGLKYLTSTIALLLFFSIFFECQAADTSEKSTDKLVKTKFLLGWENDHKSVQGAIIFELEPGWKTYWRNPGEYGVVPKFDWHNSTNIKEIHFAWPIPKLFNQYNVPVLGYKKLLLLPIKIVKKNILKPVILNMNLSFGICSNICILKSTTILTVIDKVDQKNPHGPIRNVLKNLPKKLPQEDTLSINCKIFNYKKELTIEYAMNFKKKPTLEPIAIIEYLPNSTMLENHIITKRENEFFVRASLESLLKAEGAIERKRINSFFVYNDTALEIKGCS